MTSLKHLLSRLSALLLGVPVLALVVFGGDVRALLPERAAVNSSGWRVVDSPARANMARVRSSTGVRADGASSRPDAVDVADWENTASRKKVSGSTF